ncbi:MAG: hypothetical protein U0414_40510 [Polyangiaceae bacterium]
MKRFVAGLAIASIAASGCVIEKKASPSDEVETTTSAGGAGGTAGTSTGGEGTSVASSTSASTSSASSNSSTGSAMPTCGGLATGACGACLETSCCAELAACDATTGCMECVFGSGTCGSSPAIGALVDCAWSECQAACTCTGPASTAGMVGSVTPQPTLGYVKPDPSGKVKVILQHTDQFIEGDAVVAIYFTPAMGQSDYPPNGAVGCAVFQVVSGALHVVDATKICEVQLSSLQFASQPGVCDGVLVGGFEGCSARTRPCPERSACR